MNRHKRILNSGGLYNCQQQSSAFRNHEKPHYVPEIVVVVRRRYRIHAELWHDSHAQALTTSPQINFQISFGLSLHDLFQALEGPCKRSTKEPFHPLQDCTCSRFRSTMLPAYKILVRLTSISRSKKEGEVGYSFEVLPYYKHHA